MNNKRAISAVVATVLIILITVAAVTIIWAAVIPMIKENTLGGTVCLDAVSGISLETEGGYTCLNSSVDNNHTLRLQISHGAKSFDLADIQVLASEDGSTTTYNLLDANLSNGNAVTVDKFPGANEQQVFVVNVSNSTPDQVEIAPIVAVGATTKTCDVAAKVVLQSC